MPDAAREKSAPQRAMHKLGLLRDIDLALHLPLRYEDETRITRLADAREGETVQVEATVAESRVEFRPRRQLVVRLVDDDGEALVLRFLNFYPSQQKTLAAGARLRVRGELRGGFLGREMVHPVGQAGRRAAADRADAGVPDQRAAAAGLPAQGGGFGAGARAAARGAAAGHGSRRPAEPARRAAPAAPSAARRAAGRAGRPQPPGLAAPEVRRTAGAAAVAADGAARARPAARAGAGRGARRPARAAARRAAVHADRRAAPRRRRDRRRPGARPADAPPAAGRCRLGQDRGGGAGRGGRHRQRLAMRADGADRDPRRAAFPQARAVAGAAGRDRGLAHRQPQGQGAQGDARSGGVGRGGAGGRHACGDPARRGLRQTRPGGRRRAAPLRRRAAAGAARQAGAAGARAAPADDERHADPAHAGDDLLRRPGGEHHRRAAARPHAGRDQALRRRPARRGDRAHPRRGGAGQAGLLGLPADRGERGARPAQRHRDPRRS